MRRARLPSGVDPVTTSRRINTSTALAYLEMMRKIDAARVTCSLGRTRFGHANVSEKSKAKFKRKALDWVVWLA